MLLNILFNEISEISEKIKCEKLRIKAKNCECLMELLKIHLRHAELDSASHKSLTSCE